MSLERAFMGVQFPILDARPLVSGYAKLEAPSWPTPIVGREFVRNCGVVRSRPKGSPLPVLGEASFVNIRGNSFLPLERVSQGKPSSRLLYRRLYGTEAGYRVDYGFRISTKKSELAASVAQRELTRKFKTPVPNSNSLAQLGDFFAIALGRFWTVPNDLDLETTAGIGPNQARDWPSRAVQSAPPLLIIERWRPRAVIRLSAETLTVKDISVQIWQLILDPHRQEESRNLRAAIWRLHYEYQVLSATLTLWKSRQTLPFDLERLHAYLDATTRLLVKRSYGGYNQHSLMALAAMIDGIDDTLLLDSLSYLRTEAKAIAKRIDLILERMCAAQIDLRGSAWSVMNVNNFKKVESVMGDQIKISKSNDVNIVHRSDGGTIQKYTLASPQILAELTSLREDPAIAAEPGAIDVLDELIDEVKGPRRFERCKELWSRLKAAAPVISLAIAGANLTNALLGG